MRVPADIDNVATNFAITRTWEGVTVDLERKALMYGEDEAGHKIATYAFVVPGTQNPECFLCIYKVAGTYHWEASRCGAAEMHIYYKGAQVVTMPYPPNHIGYFGGVAE